MLLVNTESRARMVTVKKKVINFQKERDKRAKRVQDRLNRSFKRRQRERQENSKKTTSSKKRTPHEERAFEGILFAFEAQIKKLLELYLMKEDAGFVSGYADGQWQLSGNRRPDLKPINLFKALSYGLICDMIETEDGRSAIALLYSSKIVGPRAPEFLENPFYAALRCAGPDNALKRGAGRDDSFMTQHELGLFSRQMLYAYDRGVCPEDLCGFLFQSGYSNRISNDDVNACTELTRIFDIPKEIRNIDPFE